MVSPVHTTGTSVTNRLNTLSKFAYRLKSPDTPNNKKLKALNVLLSYQPTEFELRETQLGRVVKKLVANSELKLAANEVIVAWKTVLQQNLVNQHKHSIDENVESVSNSIKNSVDFDKFQKLKVEKSQAKKQSKPFDDDVINCHKAKDLHFNNNPKKHCATIEDPCLKKKLCVASSNDEPFKTKIDKPQASRSISKNGKPKSIYQELKVFDCAISPKESTSLKISCHKNNPCTTSSNDMCHKTKIDKPQASDLFGSGSMNTSYSEKQNKLSTVQPQEKVKDDNSLMCKTRVCDFKPVQKPEVIHSQNIVVKNGKKNMKKSARLDNESGFSFMDCISIPNKLSRKQKGLKVSKQIKDTSITDVPLASEIEKSIFSGNFVHPHVEPACAISKVASNSKPGADMGDICSKYSTERKMWMPKSSGNCSGVVPSLAKLCQNVLMAHRNSIEHVGLLPYYIMKPIMAILNPNELLRLEEHNKQFIVENDCLWEKIFTAKMRSRKRNDNESFRDAYLRCIQEDKIKYNRLVGKVARSTQSELDKVSKTQLTTFSGIRKNGRVRNSCVQKVPRASTKWNSNPITELNKQRNQIKRDFHY